MPLPSARAAVLAGLLLAGCAGARAPAPAAGTATSAASTPPAPWPDLAPLEAVPAALLFHRHSQVPFPEVELASSLPGVCRVADPDARKEALDAAWERLRQLDRATAARRRWLVTLPQALGGYDLARGAFPTGLGRDAGPRFDYLQYCGQAGMHYAVALENWQAFALVPVPVDRARDFVRANNQRLVHLDLEVEVAGAEAGEPQALLVRIRRLRVRDDAGGAVLADTGPR